MRKSVITLGLCALLSLWNHSEARAQGWQIYVTIGIIHYLAGDILGTMAYGPQDFAGYLKPAGLLSAHKEAAQQLDLNTCLIEKTISKILKPTGGTQCAPHTDVWNFTCGSTFPCDLCFGGNNSLYVHAHDIAQNCPACTCQLDDLTDNTKSFTY